MIRGAGKWILPQPEEPDEEYVSIPRIARTIPFGYKVDPEDPDMLLPIDSELRALEKAKKYLEQYSYREVAAWLSRHTGRVITFSGLKKRIDSEQSNKRRASTLREWARRYEKAIAKAEKIDKERLGATEKTETDTGD